MEAALAVNLDTDTFAFFAQLRRDGSVRHRRRRADGDRRSENRTELRQSSVCRQRQTPLIHSFDGQGLDNQHSSRTAGSATGIGDITLRGKVRFLDKPGGGLAVSADLRLPTGKEEDLLGTGATQFTATFIGSAAFGKFAPHVNLGYTLVQRISDDAEAAFVARAA